MKNSHILSILGAACAISSVIPQIPAAYAKNNYKGAGRRTKRKIETKVFGISAGNRVIKINGMQRRADERERNKNNKIRRELGMNQIF